MFIFGPIQRAVLLVGGDKSGLWSRSYNTAIPAAEGAYEAYLASPQYRYERREHDAGDDDGR